MSLLVCGFILTQELIATKVVVIKLTGFLRGTLSVFMNKLGQEEKSVFVIMAPPSDEVL
jgi:hypothetical protein